jgi:magnesium chelatase family protein
MLARIASTTLLGIEALAVDVEVDVATGLPGYHVVGLPAPPVKEGAVRIRSALEQVGHELPHKKVTVNLAPADVRKPSTALDLPIAVGVLVADGLYPVDVVDGLVLLGELGLDGSLRAVRGALASAMLARARGLRGIVVPEASAAEAVVVDGLEVYAIAHLGEMIEALAGGALPAARGAPPRRRPVTIDMSDVRGQAQARAAVEVAVAGGHNLLLTGPPGIGKPGPMDGPETVLPSGRSSSGAGPAARVAARPVPEAAAPGAPVCPTAARCGWAPVRPPAPPARPPGPAGAASPAITVKSRAPAKAAAVSSVAISRSGS